MSSRSVDVWKDTKYLNRRCSVKGCDAPSIGGLPTLHTYPKEKRLKDQWIEFVSKTHKNPKHIRWGAVCSLHFKDEDFENLNIVKMGFGRRLRLKRDAVPVIYPQMINIESLSRFQEIPSSGKTPCTQISRNEIPIAPAEAITNDIPKTKLSIESIMKALKKTPDPLQKVAALQNSRHVPKVAPNANDNVPKKKWLKVKIVCKRKIPKPAVVTADGAKAFGEPNQKKLKEEIPETNATVAKFQSHPTVEENTGNTSSSYLAKDGTSGQDYVNEILQSMYSMQRNGTLCDFSLVVPSTTSSEPHVMTFVKVHRLVFAAVSEKIRNHRSDAIKLADNVQVDDLLHVIEFVYTGKMKQIKDFSILQVMRICNAAAALDIVKCVKYLQTNRPEAVQFAIPEIVEQPSRMGECADESNEDAISLLTNPGVSIKEEYDLGNIDFFPIAPKEDVVQRESEGDGTNVHTQTDDEKSPTLSSDVESDLENNSGEDDLELETHGSANLNGHASTPIDSNDKEPVTGGESSSVIKQERIDPKELSSLSPFVLQIKHRKNVLLD